MKTKFTKSLEKTFQGEIPGVMGVTNSILVSNTNWKNTLRQKIDFIYSWILQKGAMISCLVK